MSAFIATLEGDYAPSRSYNYSARRYYHDGRVTDDFMGGFFQAIGGMAKSAWRVGTAPIKGATHGIMEVGRGIATGDVKRILAAPIRSMGHIGGEAYRGTKLHGEYYWRASKMSQWMGPAGVGMSAVAPFTGPAAPFLLAGGAALTIGGKVGSKIHQTHLQRQAARAAARGEGAEAAAYQQRAGILGTQGNTWLYVGGAALLGGALLLMT